MRRSRGGDREFVGRLVRRRERVHARGYSVRACSFIRDLCVARANYRARAHRREGIIRPTRSVVTAAAAQ